MKGRPKILVIGDIMLDVCIKGAANRLSPEAPCPVLEDCQSPSYSLGGAANVAWQISASNFDVHLYGCIGEDGEGNRANELISEAGIHSHLIIDIGCQTTRKVRFLTKDNRQLLRVDRDCSYNPTPNDFAPILHDLDTMGYDIAVFSDYNKGFLTDELCQSIISLCRQKGIPVVVDLKKSYTKYTGATVIKGNQKEIDWLCNSLQIAITDIPTKLASICESLQCGIVVMTAGEEGIYGYSTEEGYMSLSASKISIFDVTGAGDVVTAFIVMQLLENNTSFNEILSFANKAAEKKVSQPGKLPISIEDVKRNHKLVDLTYLKGMCKNKKVVFTNGCFDVIHAGHISLLNRAKNYGDILVVAVNSDASVKRLKGERRPVNILNDRILVLSSISCVDYILVFDDDTPLSLIKALKPDVLVKGGDYKISDIIGSDYIQACGGEVYSIPLYENLSSTNILMHLRHE